MISLAEVKEQLGITDGTYDAEITAMIPIAEARYREIAGYNFYNVIWCEYDTGTNYFRALNYNLVYNGEFLGTDYTVDSDIVNMNFGDIIENHPDGAGVPSGAYITNIDKLNGYIYISDTFTDDGDQLAVTVNISYKPTISGIIWYLIGKQSITAQDAKNVTGRTVGPLSVTFAPNEINNQYGIPQKFVDAIPKFQSMF